MGHDDAWAATQPHHPFPMLAETQAVSMESLLRDDTDTERDDEADDAAVDEADDAAVDVAEMDVGEMDVGELDEPSPHPYVARGDDGATFEIDEVEALPEDDAGVMDLHEGASAFVPVDPRAHDPRD